MNTRVLFSLIPCLLAFAGMLGALWDHDLRLAAGWFSATAGWVTSMVAVWGED